MTQEGISTVKVSYRTVSLLKNLKNVIEYKTGKNISLDEVIQTLFLGNSSQSIRKLLSLTDEEFGNYAYRTYHLLTYPPRRSYLSDEKLKMPVVRTEKKNRTKR